MVSQSALSNNEERAMPRTQFRTLLTLGAILVASPSALLAAEQKSTVDKPNIVFILADDLGLDGVGNYGSDTYKTQTSNIDALAKDRGALRGLLCRAAVRPVALLAPDRSLRLPHGRSHEPVLAAGWPRRQVQRRISYRETSEGARQRNVPDR
jgi:hypothetical protein